MSNKLEVIELVATQKYILDIQVKHFKKLGYKPIDEGMHGILNLTQEVKKLRKDNGFSEVVHAVLVSRKIN